MRILIKLNAVSAVSEEATYDYVFGGPPVDRPALSSSLKLTSPPIRLRSDGKSAICDECLSLIHVVYV